MKRFAFAILAFVMVASVQAKNSDVKIAYDSIPAAAQKFISTNFDGVSVKKAMSGLDDDLTIYTVTLRNKTVIEFDMTGAWNSINVTKKGLMPRFVVPDKVQEAIDGRFGDKKVMQYETDGFEYTIKFTDGSDVKINANGIVKD
ncbi:MAG: PepSY-like domain-containing protein [Paludibacteraceae bacterium]|nr:PepSY-like domain-containing protein [Paludibacteraceae bacterium]